ncbi:hypothetical protein ABB37_09439 [Leptomonas pyrrhocoris]|uniref:Flagellar attachment zone protein 1 conserved domain-containing protein n=1 Tax=Leptomonas pyrrhocoris TaxID=157538 RepID=A0A0N0VD03_LEPPY|nr:hypothetical protein ABB37_09439 [Leptomonas pyrrhocoris]XP_015652618.1 hypothetical protein ABB37_09439 [Leptomonas pyrrhocoris]KPA74178.1 hypothetical protein ABB37_09439 [Leptomonas pyrrhocoris]KPA74179.1 hypothetical protein ABB37_09439 [Leptomonas pyrrhocoris]|eukprot:XP_015652617.1 hypothetical protein ABB37_09439 [Leptomonas pyrrhocoris]
MRANPQSDSEQELNVAASSDDEGRDRIIDGLRYPRQERQIDQLGFELTKHCLHFHGADWDIPLTQKREDLTRAFISDAAAAVHEPESNIQDLRFIVTPTHLDVKLSVRHKAHISKQETQKKLAGFGWEHVKALYEPRKKVPRPKKEEPPVLEQVRQTTSHNISFFGRANVGKEGPEFGDRADDGEEPAAYEEQQAAKDRRTTSHLFMAVGLAV